MNAAAEYDVFVSYNTLDHAAVERIAQALTDRHLSVFLDRWELVPGRSWPDALEQHLSRCRAAVVVPGPSGMGPWQQREHYLALDRQAQDSCFGVIPVILPNADPALGFLSLNTWVDLRGGVDDAEAIDLLAAAIRGEPPSALLERTRRAAAQVCPYRGLEVFREEDAPFFFGREAFGERLRAAVARQPLVAVVGASGSGKSSVVRAGLIPSLRRSDGGTLWEILTLVPGHEPLQALIGALLPLLEPDMTTMDQMVEVNKQAGNLRAGDLHLRQLVDAVLAKQQGTSRLLLVVDQWEELYTYAGDEASKQASTRFVDEVLTAIETAPLTVVLTLRGDFYSEVLSHRGLSDRLQAALVNLGPMTREELERAVTKPAEKVGLGFESGLVDRLLEDVGGEPGNLPLLEFALRELWSARRGSRMCYDAYKAMGGVKGAIAERAQDIYDSLSPADKKTAERVLTRLVRPGDETGDTRRRTELSQLDAAAQALARRLAGPQARLLTTGLDPATGQETLEVAHEALIREWGRLREWVDRVRKQLRDQDLMEDLARGWQERGGGLVSGRQLRDFRRAGAPSELVQRFLDASRKRLAKIWAGTVMGAIALFGSLGGFLWWSDHLGLSLKEGAELGLYRAGLYHPSWIPEMVDIPPGSFRMGSPDPNDEEADPDASDRERPRRTVTFKRGFRLGRYEVTFAQYCVSTKRPCPDDANWGHGRQPVINVSWHDANAYVDWLKEITGREYRLPSEAEWEYAARAGAQGRYWWCKTDEPNCDVIPDVANCGGCESARGLEGIGQRTLPVDSFPANGFGLHDTAGNVDEWVQDCWHDSYAGGAPEDGSAWEEAGGEDCGRRVLRGGSRFGRPGNLRSANRAGGNAGNRNGDLGFRLAQDL
jgi:formylglycine-generating enzyme required for sulfatase activity